MCICRQVLVIALTSCSVLVATPTPTLAAEPPQRLEEAQDEPGGWTLTSQVGSGISYHFGGKASDPALGFAVGRFLSDTLQVEGQVLGLAGRPREHTWENDWDGEPVSTTLYQEQRRTLIAMTRLNLYLGKGRVRPYFSFGAGLGWGQEEQQELTTRISSALLDIDLAARHYERQELGFATLLGSGVEIGLTDRWCLRPEALMPVLWGPPQTGNITLVVGITYSTRPAHAHRGTQITPARSGTVETAEAAWRRVMAIYPGQSLRLRLGNGAENMREGHLEEPSSRTLLGSFVSASDDGVVLRVVQGARSGTWRIPRANVFRLESGRFERNGPWEGVLGGFVVGAAIGAVGYLGSGGGDDHEIWIPVGTFLFGAPAALIGGIGDHLYRTFEAEEILYDARIVVPGSSRSPQ